MKLYLNKTSPYARVARVCAIEKQLGAEVSLKWVDPWADDAELLAVNPNGKIPVLVTEAGEAISESLLIALYLDGRSAVGSLVPTPDQANVLALAGLGQGLTDAAFTTVISRKHLGPDSDSTVLGQRRHNALSRCLEQLEGLVETDVMQAGINLGQIVTAVALSYMEFRLPEVRWHQQCPRLAEWLAVFAERASMKETSFPAP